ncbi:MAG: pyridoxamine 5'-phosphate oxidase family protein [Proteobacteria bacterium]|nr:pyridoxamine 5'-phosphate oxidase family protein [Pseudomonadota bacterium]
MKFSKIALIATCFAFAFSMMSVTAEAQKRGNKGDHPGFVHIVDDKTLVVPDRAGNNRLDSLQNILRNPAVGLLFLIPGIGEVLRVNGKAEITDDPNILDAMAVKGKVPKTGIIINIEEVFYSCARSLLRSRAWEEDAKLDKRAVPSPAQVHAERTKGDEAELSAGYEQHIGSLYENH